MCFSMGHTHYCPLILNLSINASMNRVEVPLIPASIKRSEKCGARNALSYSSLEKNQSASIAAAWLILWFISFVSPYLTEYWASGASTDSSNPWLTRKSLWKRCCIGKSNTLVFRLKSDNDEIASWSNWMFLKNSGENWFSDSTTFLTFGELSRYFWESSRLFTLKYSTRCLIHVRPWIDTLEPTVSLELNVGTCSVCSLSVGISRFVAKHWIACAR